VRRHVRSGHVTCEARHEEKSLADGHGPARNPAKTLARSPPGAAAAAAGGQSRRGTSGDSDRRGAHIGRAGRRRGEEGTQVRGGDERRERRLRCRLSGVSVKGEKRGLREEGAVAVAVAASHFLDFGSRCG
jgi:hypothetical protein